MLLLLLLLFFVFIVYLLLVVVDFVTGHDDLNDDEVLFIDDIDDKEIEGVITYMQSSLVVMTQHV